jgi:hypothetical protein
VTSAKWQNKRCQTSFTSYHRTFNSQLFTEKNTVIKAPNPGNKCESHPWFTEWNKNHMERIGEMVSLNCTTPSLPSSHHGATQRGTFLRRKENWS